MRRVTPVSEGRAAARPIIREEAGRHYPIHLSPLEAHDRSIIVFVTCCSAKELPVLASDAMHRAILDAWSTASAWLVGRYVVMPNHLHMFCSPNGIQSPSLESYWKSLVTRRMGRRRGELWQRHHWDRQLRRGEGYKEKSEYVRSNPVRHGYVANADDWPYRGELHELRW